MALGLLQGACEQDGPMPPEDMEPGMVNLVLKMAVNPGKTNGERSAYAPSATIGTRADDYDFEKPTNMYEGVRTLRIIIVRKTKTEGELVEHNSYYTFPYDDDRTIWDREQEYTYKVAGDEVKRIYLIANEASVSEQFVETLRELREGEAVDLSILDNVKLTSADGAPFINNQTGPSGKFIPMTEVFEAKIPARGVNQDLKYELENSLFLTRALSKFSFSVNVAASAADFGINGMKITSIKLSGKNDTGCFADQAWLIPHGYITPDGTAQIAGGAVYDPGKYEPSTKNLNGKAIVDFSTPVDAKTFYDYTFSPESFGIPGTKNNTALSSAYVPLEYFLESSSKDFYVTVTVESNGVEQTFGPKQLPNLPYFARNTYAQIQFTFRGETMSAEVVLVPYLGVSLNPWFGFD